jgi:two-component system sensor histidine kinase AtoS
MNPTRSQRRWPRGVPSRSRDQSVVRDAAIVVLMLSAITVLNLFTNTTVHGMVLHLLYRRLYYVPVMYAGFAFGRRGGVTAAVAAMLLFAPHAQWTLGGLFGSRIDNLYEIVMYLVVGYFFGWLRDLEERRTTDLRHVSSQLEAAYATLEERALELVHVKDYTQAILRSITSGVITVGPDGSVATANPAAERMLGMPEEELVPKRLETLFDDPGDLGTVLQRVLSGRVPKLVVDTQLVTRGGTTIHAQVSISRMRDVGGRALGAVVTIEDVSEVKALTDHLIRADRLAALGELTAGVAHEVRNPLGIIRASVQLVEDAHTDPERAREATRVIKQEIDRLDKVIKALLDFGRPSTPTLRPTNIEDVVADVVLFTRRFAGQARVDIETEYAASMPLVSGDADQLKQVFVNLVSNAVQAMEGSGGTIKVRVWDDDGFVFVSVTDTGKGIPPEDLGKIFDPFYSTRDDGTGLGLTIVHRIVDQHGGRIEVESVPGAGTTFTVALPSAGEREAGQ